MMHAVESLAAPAVALQAPHCGPCAVDAHVTMWQHSRMVACKRGCWRWQQQRGSGRLWCAWERAYHTCTHPCCSHGHCNWKLVCMHLSQGRHLCPQHPADPPARAAPPLQALAAVDDLSPSEATRLVWFLYHSHQRAPRLMQALVVPLYNGLGRLSSEELVGVLLAYAGLGAYEHELFAAISEFVWDKLPEMEPAGLAAVAWSYAGGCLALLVVQLCCCAACVRHASRAVDAECHCLPPAPCP